MVDGSMGKKGVDPGPVKAVGRKQMSQAQL